MHFFVLSVLFETDRIQNYKISVRPLAECFNGFNTRTYKNKSSQYLIGEFHMADVLKKSGVRDAVSDSNVGSDFYDALDERVKELISRAEARAQDNGRKTLKARDV